MRSKSVNYDSLAVLLLLEKDLEPTPEVFRCQPSVRFIVPFQEYINFIEFCLGQYDLLATPSATLLGLVREYRLGDRETASRKLFSAFLKDMACAVCKELYFAETLGKEATSIVHSVNAGGVLSDRDIDEYFANGAVSSSSRELFQRLSCKGYAIPKYINTHTNQRLFKYAVVMNFLSNSYPFYWSYL